MRYKNEKYIYCCFVDPGFFIDCLLYDDQEEKVRGKKTDTGPFAGDSSDRNYIFCDFF